MAGDLLQAPTIRAEAAVWTPPALEARTSYGLLVLSGLLVRRVRVGRAVSSELLGAGDILRPWEEPGQWGAIPPRSEWRVLVPARLAVLDEHITRQIGRWPELTVAFSNRLVRRQRHAEYLAAVSHLPRVEDRLLAALWHLADNWGTVTPVGVRVPVRLTHELLGEIVGARRPSVTTAIHGLERSGQLRRERGGGFLLVGDPSRRDAAGTGEAGRRRQEPARGGGAPYPSAQPRVPKNRPSTTAHSATQ